MDNALAPVTERLQRAADLIQQAASDGADLVVLPALFNTGLAYSEELYERTEPADGRTVNWLHEQAHTHDVHLAGSLLLVDGDETYQSAFVIAPDGETWRYDKQFPLLWERVLFRDGHGLTIAETDIGRIGLLIGWDAAHPHLWQRYAARVEMLLVLHAEPDFSRADLHFPDETQRTLSSLNGLPAWLAPHSHPYLSDAIAQQAAWLQVPVICAGSSGTLQTILPAPFWSVGALLAASPPDWYRINGYSAAETRLIAPMHTQTHIIDAAGTTQAHLDSPGDDVLVGRVTLPEAPPQPATTGQPEIQIPPVVYPAVDGLVAGLLSLTYRRGVRRQWGARMAPRDVRTDFWLWAMALTGLIGAFAGWLLRGDDT
jgi:predicted amidohydrolase